MVAVVVLDEEGRCNYLNAIAEVLTGFGSNEAFGRKLDAILTIVGPEPLPDTALGAAVRRSAEAVGETRMLGPGGVPIPVAFRTVPLRRQDGELHGTVVELIDLTGETGAGRALRESEERLRLATAATGIGIWDVNPSVGHRRWSDEFLDILGLAPGTAADSDLFTSLIHPDDRAGVVAVYERAYSTPGDGDYHAEFRIRRASDGTERWVSTTGQVSFDAAGKPVRGVGTLRDITRRKLAEEEKELLLHELTHRVKNILALVQAIVSQTLRATTDPDEAYQRILARLGSLARTHDLLVTSRWVSASLADLLTAALTPFVGEDEARVSLSGERTELAPRAVLTIGMIAHELATNAAKYGSLSVAGGRLDVDWTVDLKDSERWVSIDWRESGGPPVSPPQARGFGSKLIERSVEANLSGAVVLDYAPTGVTCRMTFPLEDSPKCGAGPHDAT